MRHQGQIYETEYLQALFDEMQGTYEMVSSISSFGFNRRWRRQLMQRMDLRPGTYLCDLMAGSGESWAYVLPKIGTEGHLIAIDFSQKMIANAKTRRARFGHSNIDIRCEDVFATSLIPGTMDAVICVYGVKTLVIGDLERFVAQVKYLLRPGGRFGVIEVSVPHWLPLKLPYLAYLRYVVPFLGKLLLGNPENYRMLSRYTERFGDCNQLAQLFAAHGFELTTHSLFWGCATAITGVRCP